MGRVTIEVVDVSAAHVAKVPAENLRVSRAAFGQLWAYAEELGTRPGPDNDYLVGVIWTCRWLANQPVWSRVLKKMRIPPSPLTERHYSAMPETIQDEYLAAVRATARPGQFGRRVEFARGVVATLDWTWNGSGRPPLDVPTASAG